MVGAVTMSTNQGNGKMKLTLKSYVQNPEQVIWTSAKTCYSGKSPNTIWDEFIDANPQYDQFGNIDGAKFNELKETLFPPLFKHLFDSGHLSTMEHVHFVFALEGISRQTSHQIVRHRHFSFSQQSMRYVRMKDAEFDLVYNPMLNMDGKEILYSDLVMDIYNKAIEQGHHQEDARRGLPIGIKTNMVFSANLRALIDFCKVRRCVLAQKELHEVANELKRIIYKVNPLFGKALMIKCQKTGFCDEERNKDGKLCGIRPHFSTLDLKIMNVVRDDE